MSLDQHCGGGVIGLHTPGMGGEGRKRKGNRGRMGSMLEEALQKQGQMREAKDVCRPTLLETQPFLFFCLHISM